MLAAMPLTPTTAPTGEEPRSRTGDDACPGALRLHRADDGFLARVRLPGGLLTADQAEELALAAEALGDGALDLTSRGNVQVRGLGSGCGAELAERLRSAGLLPSDTHERVRNVALSPLSGLDGAGRADVTAWVRELDGLLCGTPAAAGLSGRFLFAVDDGRGDVAALGADVTLIAEPDGRALLRVGTDPAAGRAPGAPAPQRPTGARADTSPAAPPGEGAPGSVAACVGADPAPALRVPADAAPRAALLTALAFAVASRDSGAKAWRVWELPARHALTESRVRAALARAGIDAEAAPASEATAGRTSVGTPETAPLDAAPAPGLVPAPGGERAALSVAAPLGRLSLAQWRLLVAAARAGRGEMRVTPWRGVVVPGLATADARHWLGVLAEAGLVTDAASAWHGVGACTGRPGCAKSLADVRADAAGALAATTPSPTTPSPTEPTPADRRPERRLPVYWSGCERRCGHPRGRWVDVLAGAEGYRISIEGTERTAARQVAPAPRLGGPTPDAAEAERAGTPDAPDRPDAPGPTGATAPVGPLRLAELATTVAAARRVP
ncbi:nitrite reductase [Streptomyces buecherae]|uniref:nitrite reductase n=1 Tax=Streptomyces buecherae TaxID=2763006 RepID=UPI00378FA916